MATAPLDLWGARPRRKPAVFQAYPGVLAQGFHRSRGGSTARPDADEARRDCAVRKWLGNRSV